MAEKEETKKVKRPTAKKRELQHEKKRLRNKAFKSKVSTAISAFKNSVNAKDASATAPNLNEVYSLMDKGVKTGVYKINKAARVKSRLHHFSKA